MVHYNAPIVTGKTRAAIFKIGETVAARAAFLPGDRIEPLVSRLGGTIEYLGSTESVQALDGSLYVDGPRDFRILVSAFTGPERDRFTIAHELGHYVLHSDHGKIPIRAARFGSNPVEWEANWFAAAFLMPERDFRDAWKRYSKNLALVAARYMVSEKAAEVRVSTLGI